MLKRLAHIISPRFRVKRELLFRRLFGDVIERGCRILDVDGEPEYWEYSIGAAKDFSAESKERLRTRNRLLKLRELTELFPEGTIVKERLMGMVKSFIVHNAS